MPPMMADSRVAGIFPLQHRGYNNRGWDLQLRASIFGARITDRLDGAGDVGHWVIDPDSIGDIHGGQLLKKGSREVPMWRFATPVVVISSPSPSDERPPVPTPGTPPGSPIATPSVGPPIATGGGSPIQQDGGAAPSPAGQAASPQGQQTGKGGAPLGGEARETINPIRPNPGDGGGAPVATGGGGGGGSSGGLGLLPIMDGAYNPDGRLLPIPASTPKDWPKFPKGTIGISLIGNEEAEQFDLFFPTDPRLIAVNKAGDREMGSLVFDLTSKSEMDKERKVPLHGMFHVIKKPLGGSNALGWQLGMSGRGDVQGGYIVDGPGVAQAGLLVGGPFDVPAGGCKHTYGRDADGRPISPLHFSIASLFRDGGKDGPLNVSNYKKGDEQDIVVPVHFGWDGASQTWNWYTTTSIYPVEVEPPPPPPPPPKPPRPWIVGDPAPVKPVDVATPGSRPNTPTQGPPTRPNTAPTGPVMGPPIPTGVPGPGHHGTQGGAAANATSNSGYLMTDAPLGMGTFLNKPYSYAPNQVNPNPYASMALGGAIAAGVGASGGGGTSGRPDTASGVPGPGANGGTKDGGSKGGAKDAANKRKTEGPISGGMSGFGAQGGAKPSDGSDPAQNTSSTGDPWNYTQRPGQSKWKGGTSKGGWVIHPPEIGLETQPRGMAALNGQTLSKTFFGTAPEAYFFCAIPDIIEGSPQDGIAWGIDEGETDLEFRVYTNGAEAGSIFKLATAGGFSIKNPFNTLWGSFSYVSNVTATWSMPDVSGYVLANQDYGGVGGGSVVTFGGTGTGPSSGAQANWIKVRTSAGADAWIPIWF